jgi:hypothetical protein
MLARALVLVLCSSLLAACAEEEPAETAEREQRRKPRLITEPPPIEPLPADSEPSPLIGPLVSMASLEEVIAALPDDQPFQVQMNRRSEKRGACPGQHYLELQITRFWDLDRKGTLHLQFYDDMLTQAWFKTFDTEGYRQAFFALHELERPNRWKPTYLLPGSVIKNPVMGNQGMLIEDFRIRKYVDAVEKACRHQTQKERGWLDDASEASEAS